MTLPTTPFIEQFKKDAEALADKYSNDTMQAANADTRTCTCYPGEGPLPCPRQFALRECWRVAVLAETQQHIVRLKNQDRHANEQALLDYLMRVRECLER